MSVAHSSRPLTDWTQPAQRIRKEGWEAGLGNGVIKRWNETSPQCNKLELVANYLQVSIEWLSTGKDPSTFTKEEKELIQAYNKADARTQEIVKLSLQPYMPQETKLSNSQIG